MSNKFQINPDSLFFRVLIKSIFLLLGILLLVLCVAFIPLKYFLLETIIIFSVLIYFHRNRQKNIDAINKIYSFYFKIGRLLKENLYSLLDFIYWILNILFFIFTVYYIFNYAKEVNTHGVLQAVPIVITVSSFILTAVFAALQYFGNKFPDFTHLMQSWKNKLSCTFVALLIYSICSFIAFYDNSFQIDFWLLIASIYLVFTLFVIGLKSALLMNHSSIMNVQRAHLLSLIKKLPNLVNPLAAIGKEKEIHKNIFRKGFRNFIKYKVLGIVPKTFYDTPQDKLEEIKNKIEPLFRICANCVRENDYNDFSETLGIVTQIIYALTGKIKDGDSFKYYEFFAAKLMELFDIAVSSKRPYFLEKIVDTNEKIVLNIVYVASREYRHIQIDFSVISCFINNSKSFVLKSVSQEHSPSSGIAIDTLRKVAHLLIEKGEFDLVTPISNDLMSLATEIQMNLLGKKDALNLPWLAHLTKRCLFGIMNILFYATINSLYKETSTGYLIKKTKENFIEVFKFLSKYPAIYATPYLFLKSVMMDTKLELLLRSVDEYPHIKNIYSNRIRMGMATHFETVVDIGQIYSLISVRDFDNKANFQEAFQNLIAILPIVSVTNKILIDNGNEIWAESSIDCLKSIAGSAFLFLKRARATSYNVEKNTQLVINLLEQVLCESLKIFKIYMGQEHRWHHSSISKYIIHLYIFIARCIENKIDKIMPLVENHIQEIIKIIENMEEDNRAKEDTLSNLRLLCVAFYGNYKKTKIFKVLFRFIIQHTVKYSSNRPFDYSMYEKEGLPSNSDRLIECEEFVRYKRFEGRFEAFYCR